MMHEEFEPVVEDGKKKSKVPSWLWCLVLILSAAVIVTSAVMVYVIIKYYNIVNEQNQGYAPYGAKMATEVDAEGRTPFTFDDIFSSDFRYKSFSGKWLKDTNELTYKDDAGDVIAYNASSGAERVLINSTLLEGSYTYSLSADVRYVLIASNYEQIWRHSYYANYKIIDLQDPTTSISFPNQDDLKDEKMRYAAWAPDGHALVFVYGNNLYYQADVTSRPVQLTDDGHEIYRFNGIPDWLYEEDVLSTRVATYFSTEARYIVYAAFNDSEVDFIRYPLYGASDSVYTTLREISYPIAGLVTEDKQPGANSVADLYVVDTNDLGMNLRRQISPPSALADQDHYFTSVHWRDDTHVLITWTNRIQNHGIVTICDVTQSEVQCEQNYELEIDGGWIDAPWTAPRFIKDGSHYLTKLPQNVGDSGTWKHVALLSGTATSEDNTPIFLTEGEQEIVNIVGYNEELERVYYVTTNGDSRERHLFSVGLNSTADPATCVSCSLTSVPASHCLYVSASMSTSAEHLILGCTGPEIPSYHLVQVDGLTSVVMENNDAFRTNVEKKQIAERGFVELDLENGHKGWAEVFNEHDDGTKRPLLVYTYAGPGSQRVTMHYPMGSSVNNWLTYLKSTYGIVVASLDGRGTNGAGDKKMFELYRGFGTVEVTDQIQLAETLQKEAYVDTEKDSAVFGWSYGGFVTSHVMGRESDVIKCGAAVAPVTSQRYYDTAYTERYMALVTPDDNEAGYNYTDVMRHVENFRGKKYLIAHGTDDDNVHFRHAAELVRALAEAEIQFETLMYVDENHAINSPHQSRHLFQALTNFLVDDCWGLSDPVDPTVAPTDPPSGATTNYASSFTAAILLSLLALVLSR